MKIATAAVNKSLFDYAEATCQSFLIHLGSSCCINLHSTGGRWVIWWCRRWVENMEEDVSERVWGGVGRHGGPLDFITSRWQIHTIRGTSHIIRPPPHMNWSRRSVSTFTFNLLSFPQLKTVLQLNQPHLQILRHWNRSGLRVAELIQPERLARASHFQKEMWRSALCVSPKRFMQTVESKYQKCRIPLHLVSVWETTADIPNHPINSI